MQTAGERRGGAEKCTAILVFESYTHFPFLLRTSLISLSSTCTTPTATPLQQNVPINSLMLLFTLRATANTIGDLTKCCSQKSTTNSPLPLPINLIRLQRSPPLTKHNSHLPAPSSLTHTEPSSLNGECNRGVPAHQTQHKPTTVTRLGHPMRGSTINCTTPHCSHTSEN